MDVVTANAAPRPLERVLSIASAMAASRVGLGATLGLVWGGPSWTVGLTPGVVALWWAARSRVEAWLLMTAYHAVAARSLMVGTTQFFDVPLALGVAAVGGCAALLALAWALGWSAGGRDEPVVRAIARLSCVLFVTACPPLGAWGVASPLAAAGVWLPGSGWFGLVATVLGLANLRRVPCTEHVVAIGLACCMGNLAAGGGSHARPLAAVNTHVDVSRSAEDFVQQWTVARSVQPLVLAADAEILVLPESVGGLWQPRMARTWETTARVLEANERVAVVGAILPRADADFDNGAVFVGASEPPYRQRFPVPLAMWRPWDEGRGEGVYRAHWFARGTVRLRGATLGVLVCFEGGLVWPVLQSVAEGAEALVALTNGQWLRGTGAVAAQRQSLESWGRLFDLPVVLAVNE